MSFLGPSFSSIWSALSRYHFYLSHHGDPHRKCHCFFSWYQIEMLHTELNFERYLKEQHIQRIRRLRRENIKIQAFQIEHTSMV